MTPTRCRVQTLTAGAEAEAAGTIEIRWPEGGEALLVKVARPDLEVTATLSRDEAFAFLLAGAEALGMILLDPREAARRHAARMKRGR
jgi:hypothetical protein